MLLHEFKKYNKGDAWDEDTFSVFYQQYCLGKSFVLILEELAYQVYELQECMEGLLQDADRGEG